MRTRRVTRSATTARAKSGYTLIEMMVVVAITGVLTALAIPAFNGYMQRGRAAEAVTFLGVIKLREEAYRSEFGAYLGSGNALSAFSTTSNWMPTANVSGTDTRPWATNSVFTAIGAKPDGAVRFAYAIVAGSPADGAFLNNAPYNVPTTEIDFWFIARAQTDLNSDNVDYVCEATSFSRTVWCGRCDGGDDITCEDDDNGWD
jgi:prepilin-type N-terminal cleavage/methylation domain-containing protein